MTTYLHFFETKSQYKEHRENNYEEPWVSFTEGDDDEKTPISVTINGTLNITEWYDEHEEDPTEADFTNHEYDGIYMYYGNEGRDDAFSASNGTIIVGDANSIDPQSEFIFDKVMRLNGSLDYGLLVTDINFDMPPLNRVDYNKTERDTPLTFEITIDGVIRWYTNQRTSAKSIQYKKNNDEWIYITSATGSSAPSISVVAGDIVQFKGDNATYGVAPYGDYYNCFSGTTCGFKVKNNIMSLINSTDFATATTLESAFTFSNLFDSCTGLTDASNLILPATTLADNCYRLMFAGCTSLVNVPELPALTLKTQCYSSMFAGCTSLISAPELPATTLADYCYYGMLHGCTSITSVPSNYLPITTLATACYGELFYGCTNLVNVPKLPATTLTVRCYESMFRDCTSLVNAPALPATTVADSCYYRMFQGCTNLVSVPSVLPATTLMGSCYEYMFSGCTGLTTAPELPATTLAAYCYRGMFQNCTSLVNAPELPATTLADYCYRNMFYSCTSLNYIKCLATTVSATNCKQNWVSGVASSGTFVKSPNITTATWGTGDSGIPTNWTVQDDTNGQL